jgi:Xaa-Pro aminopeptidase
MLTQSGCLARRKRLWDALPSAVEWVLVADPRHVLYFSGFWVSPMSFSAHERAWLLLERDGKTTLLGDNFTVKSRVEDPFVDDEVVSQWYDHRHSVVNRDHALIAAVEQISDRLYGREGAVEAEWLSVGAVDVLGLDYETHSVRKEAQDSPDNEPVDLGTVIRTLRRKKEPDEIELIQQCTRACEAGQARARDVIRPGLTDFDMFREVHAAVLEAAGQPCLIYGDFRETTPKQPKAGGFPVGAKLEAGNLFILDYSVVMQCYRCDFTNTLAIDKQPTADQQRLFDIVSAAMKAGEQTFRAGVPARDVFDAVETPIRDAGLAENFKHHAGHGIGLGHPEPPILVPDSDDVLIAGDVVTLEPGLYVEGIGGLRIENNYRITESGFEQLSHHRIGL